MAASALLLPISFITLLMILVRSYGTASTDLVGFLSVVVAPPTTLVAGFGLLRRWPWARFYLAALGLLLIALNVAELRKGGVSTTTYTSAAGVRTTQDIWGGPNLHSVPIILFCGFALVMLFTPSVRREFSGRGRPAGPAPQPPEGARDRTWRVGHIGRDRMFYEEQSQGAWQRIEIEGEMLTGRAHHAIYFGAPERWLHHPAWARHRRDEIIARIKSEFRSPDYEYDDTTAGPPPLPATRPAVRPMMKPSEWAALLAVMAILLGIAGGMGWLVGSGLNSGTTYLPLKRTTLQREVSRIEEPATFWLALGVYAGAGVASFGGSLWFGREAWRLARR